MRYENNRKLIMRFIKPLKTLEEFSDVEYRLVFPPYLSVVNLIFHVSMLKRYSPNDTHVIRWDSTELGHDFSYENDPIAILY